MSKLGSFLKKERERQSISIQEIGLSLKISTRVLTAIEEGDKANLPARTFLRGFVRSYALHLHLDPQQALHLFNEEFGLPPVPETAPPPPADEAPLEKKPPKSKAQPPPEKPKREETPATTKSRSLPGPSLFENKILTAGISIFVLIVVVGVIKTVNKYQRERVSPVSPVVVPTPEEPSLPNPDSVSADPVATPLLEATAPTATPPVASTPETAPAATPAPESTAEPTPEPTPVATPSPTPEPTPETPVATSAPVSEAAPVETATPPKPGKPFDILSIINRPAEAPLSSEHLSMQVYLARPTPTPDPTPLAEPTPTSEPTATPTPEPSATPKPETTPIPESTPKATPAATPTPAPTPVATPEAGAPTGQTFEIIIEARADVKVDFQPGSQPARSTTLSAGEIFTIKARDTLSLTLDNGGAAAVYINGLDRGRAPEGKPLTLKLPEPQ